VKAIFGLYQAYKMLKNKNGGTEKKEGAVPLRDNGH